NRAQVYKRTSWELQQNYKRAQKLTRQVLCSHYRLSPSSKSRVLLASNFETSSMKLSQSAPRLHRILSSTLILILVVSQHAFPMPPPRIRLSGARGMSRSDEVAAPSRLRPPVTLSMTQVIRQLNLLGDIADQNFSQQRGKKGIRNPGADVSHLSAGFSQDHQAATQLSPRVRVFSECGFSRQNDKGEDGSACKKAGSQLEKVRHKELESRLGESSSVGEFIVASASKNSRPTFQGMYFPTLPELFLILFEEFLRRLVGSCCARGGFHDQ
ncbi:hypothetical protein PSHT_14482, partial [Puccinia striiformis]